MPTICSYPFPPPRPPPPPTFPPCVAGGLQDMIGRVAERRPGYNNAASVSASAWATQAKLAYYRAFAALYGCMGGLVDTVMVNGSWTKAHIESLWGLPVPVTLRRGSDGAATVLPLDDEVAYRPVMGVTRSLLRATGWQSHAARPAARLVYPPCNTTALAALPLGGRERLVVSVAQFRPEKDHALQLRAFAAFRKMGERLRAREWVRGGGWERWLMVVASALPAGSRAPHACLAWLSWSCDGPSPPSPPCGTRAQTRPTETCACC
jgi:hypothetical protein